MRASRPRTGSPSRPWSLTPRSTSGPTMTSRGSGRRHRADDHARPHARKRAQPGADRARANVPQLFSGDRAGRRTPLAKGFDAPAVVTRVPLVARVGRHGALTGASGNVRPLALRQPSRSTSPTRRSRQPRPGLAAARAPSSPAKVTAPDLEPSRKRRRPPRLVHMDASPPQLGQHAADRATPIRVPEWTWERPAPYRPRVPASGSPLPRSSSVAVL